MNAKDRLFWLDAVRVISSILVVLQHGMSPEWVRLGAEAPESAEWRIMNFIFMIARMAVPLFFMASGAVMLRRERGIREIWTHNIAGIVITYVAWMMVYGIKEAIVITMNGHATPRVIVNAFIKQVLFGSYHTWFLMALLGLYILTPLLSVIARDEKRFAYLCLISFIATCVIPLVTGLDDSDRLAEAVYNFSPSYVSGYLLYYLLGFYIARKPIAKRSQTYLLIAMPVIAVITYMISNYLSVRRMQAVQEPYASLSLLGVIMAAIIFCLSKEILTMQTETPGYRRIRFLADTSVGVYLLHPLFHETIIDRFSGLKSLIAALIVWLICLVVCGILYLNKTTRRIFLHS